MEATSLTAPGVMREAVTVAAMLIMMEVEVTEM